MTEQYKRRFVEDDVMARQDVSEIVISRERRMHRNNKLNEHLQKLFNIRQKRNRGERR